MKSRLSIFAVCGGLLLGLLAVSPFARADVKSKSAFLPAQCGLAQAFPDATEICLGVRAGVQGQYLSTRAINADPNEPTAPRRLGRVKFYRVTKSLQSEGGSIYVAREAGVDSWSVKLESKEYQLRIGQLKAGKAIASFSVDGSPLPGAEEFEVEVVNQTR